MLLLADVDGDGMLELVTGHTDRAVYVHKLEADCQKQTNAQSQPNIGIIFMFSLIYYFVSHWKPVSGNKICLSA